MKGGLHITVLGPEAAVSARRAGLVSGWWQQRDRG